MKILIAEDDTATRALFQAIFDLHPEHQVTLVADGQEAWKLLDDANRWFDVAILDQQMPGLTGLELLRRIRDAVHLQNLDTIMCTVVKDRDTITKAIAFGTTHYLIKPPAEATLMAKLAQIAAARSPGGRR
jgi:two-component system, chemotaxis family, chemotaxis protein CheY